MTSLSKSEARRVRLRASALLIEGLLAAQEGAVRVRSGEPSAAWAAGGEIAYAFVDVRLTPERPPDPFWGPPPLVLSLGVNRRPPPGLRYAARGGPVAGLVPGAALAAFPVLELQLLPEEAGPYGTWVPAWYDWAAAGGSWSAPATPSPLDGGGLAGSIVWTLPAADMLREWYDRERG